jgi:hypothetical protein
VRERILIRRTLVKYRTTASSNRAAETAAEMRILIGGEASISGSRAGFKPSRPGTCRSTDPSRKAGEMADIHRFSEQVIELAERLSDVADAANGKGIRRGSLSPRWVILPAAGAGLYALATSGSFTRQAKGAMNQAKKRASELPDDLLSRVRQTSQKSASRSGGQTRGQTSSSRKTNSAKTTSGR